MVVEWGTAQLFEFVSKVRSCVRLHLTSRGVKEAIHVKLKKISKPGWWPKTLPVTHIQCGSPLSGAKSQTFTSFDET